MTRTDEPTDSDSDNAPSTPARKPSGGIGINSATVVISKDNLPDFSDLPPLEDTELDDGGADAPEPAGATDSGTAKPAGAIKRAKPRGGGSIDGPTVAISSDALAEIAAATAAEAEAAGDVPLDTPSDTGPETPGDETADETEVATSAADADSEAGPDDSAGPDNDAEPDTGSKTAAVAAGAVIAGAVGTAAVAARGSDETDTATDSTDDTDSPDASERAAKQGSSETVDDAEVSAAPDSGDGPTESGTGESAESDADAQVVGDPETPDPETPDPETPDPETPDGESAAEETPEVADSADDAELAPVETAGTEADAAEDVPEEPDTAEEVVAAAPDTAVDGPVVDTPAGDAPAADATPAWQADTGEAGTAEEVAASEEPTKKFATLTAPGRDTGRDQTPRTDTKPFGESTTAELNELDKPAAPGMVASEAPTDRTPRLPTDSPAAKAPVEKLPRPSGARPIAGTPAAPPTAKEKTDGWSTTRHRPQPVGATDTAKSGGRKKWWLVAAVVAVLAIVGVVAALLNTNKSTPEVDRAAEAARTYGNAVYTGDLDTLRSITCGVKREEFTQWDGKEQQYQELYEQQKAANQLVRVNRVTAAMINDDGTANVQVEAVNTSRPTETEEAIIVLRKVEGDWKVCNAP
ncbi:DUF4878 domain-containing protein [Gordonia pseudamarae]|uniref:Rv0361 family membrane protein n=1 Tax=Gordonia pseudamarae TaxID=2831662 RepID=UPI001AF09E7B|nr:DUF4878 domain-containing protein [Gordonia pseudamarae]QHN25182.1 DUF4878 domain-containing protein [Gordonia pseudamarae]